MGMRPRSLEVVFMWNNGRSIVLSKICVILFALILLAVGIFAYKIIIPIAYKPFDTIFGTVSPFLLTAYTGLIPAFSLLALLYTLLHRIGKGQVFVPQNVKSLRLISWCCFFGAFLSLASTFYYFMWIFVAVAAAFMGLIVRIVKNVFAKAVELQEDADFTI